MSCVTTPVPQDFSQETGWLVRGSEYISQVASKSEYVSPN